MRISRCLQRSGPVTRWTNTPVRIFKDPPPHPPPPTPTTLHRSGPPAYFVHMTGPIVPPPFGWQAFASLRTTWYEDGWMIL